MNIYVRVNDRLSTILVLISGGNYIPKYTPFENAYEIFVFELF